jgi:hypothetical protein
MFGGTRSKLGRTSRNWPRILRWRKPNHNCKLSSTKVHGCRRLMKSCGCSGSCWPSTRLRTRSHRSQFWPNPKRPPGRRRLLAKCPRRRPPPLHHLRRRQPRSRVRLRHPERQLRRPRRLRQERRRPRRPRLLRRRHLLLRQLLQLRQFRHRRPDCRRHDGSESGPGPQIPCPFSFGRMIA